MALNMAHKQGVAVPLFIASCFLTDSSCLAKLSSFIRRYEGNKFYLSVITIQWWIHEGEGGGAPYFG